MHRGITRFSLAVVAIAALLALGPLPATAAPSRPDDGLNVALGKPATASATWAAPGYDPAMAVDGDYYTYWNSGAFAPQWIEIDLGRTYAVTGVVLWVTMLPDGYTHHTVLTRTEQGPEWTTAWTIEGPTADSQRLVAGLTSPSADPGGPTFARYIRVVTDASPSWVAWREVEVYADPKASLYHADCVVAGRLDVTAVFFADPNAKAGGSTGAFHVVGDNRVFHVYAPGTDSKADDFCHFTWSGGAVPGVAFDGTVPLEMDALVFVTPPVVTWDPARDWRNAPAQQNPSGDIFGNDGVWSYMRSSGSGFVHDPSTYVLLPNYWVDAEQWSDEYALVGHDYATSGTIRMHPSWGRVEGIVYDAILAWSSPVTGRISVTGDLQLGDPACNYLGSGIIWSIDKGSTTLYQAEVAAGAASDFAVTVNVREGETIYFVQDPGWDSNCDTAIVSLNISQ